MRRLRELSAGAADESTDPAVTVLIGAVSAAEPLASSPERQARILARVLERRRPRRSLSRFFLRPAFAAALLLLAGLTTAAATMAPRLRWGQNAELPAAAPPRAVLPSPRSSAPAGPAFEPLDAPAPVEPVVRPMRRPAPRARLAAGESPSRVVAAVRALRSDHDPERAQRLAVDYLRVYPRGALAEEALAVAIEAAALRGDPQAAQLSARYLRQYPGGRFRRVAEQALQRQP